MVPEEGSEPRDGGEWELFVSRAVMDVRREFGEVAADRVATLLMAQKAEALEVDRRHLATTEHLLDQALAELQQTRRERDGLRGELAELQAGIREARAELEAETARSEQQHLALQAELDARAGEANEKLAAAWAQLREHEQEIATRRAELLRIEDVIGERLAEAESRLIDADNLRAAAAADRAEAQRLVDEATKNWEAAQSLAQGYDGVRAAADYAAKVEETVIELRESAQVEETRRALDARDLELREWEAELVRRTQELDLRDEARRRRDGGRPDREDPLGSRPSAGWGRGRRRNR